MRLPDLTRFVHSRHALLLTALITVCATIYAFTHGCVAPSLSYAGWLGLPSEAIPTAHGGWGMAVCGIAINLAIAFGMVALNKTYNIIRSLTHLYASMFLIMQCALPALAAQPSAGTTMCLALLMGSAPLLDAYQAPGHTRNIFLAFFIVACGVALTGVAQCAYLVAMFIGCAQMRVLCIRGFLAAIFGIVTPLWILWGFSIVSVADISLSDGAPSVLDADSRQQFLLVGAYTAITLLTAFGLGLFNMLKIYSYNARSRAYNGFFVILTLITAVMLLADMRHVYAYLPMLNMCVALQIGQFFNINRQRHSYLGVFCLVALYAAVYTASLMI